MNKQQTLAVVAGAAVVGGGGLLAWDRGWLKGIGLPGPGSVGSTQTGITVKVGPHVASPLDRRVGGPSPGPSGQYTYPALWSLAPKSLPQSYQGGPTISRRGGYVWLTIATGLTVTGTYQGGSPATAGPWNGVAEYQNGSLLRVYPQPATAFSGQLAALGAWSGGGA